MENTKTKWVQPKTANDFFKQLSQMLKELNDSFSEWGLQTIKKLKNTSDEPSATGRFTPFNRPAPFNELADIYNHNAEHFKTTLKETAIDREISCFEEINSIVNKYIQFAQKWENELKGMIDESSTHIEFKENFLDDYISIMLNKDDLFHAAKSAANMAEVLSPQYFDSWEVSKQRAAERTKKMRKTARDFDSMQARGERLRNAWIKYENL